MMTAPSVIKGSVVVVVGGIVVVVVVDVVVVLDVVVVGGIVDVVVVGVVVVVVDAAVPGPKVHEVTTAQREMTAMAAPPHLIDIRPTVPPLLPLPRAPSDHCRPAASPRVCAVQIAGTASP
jgi:hypothetical protein